MVLMPAFCAFLRHALPESESRLVMSRTLTSELIMLSQMVPNLALLPFAFWMSAWTPAAWKAAVSSGRSLASQRGEVEASGRITPTLPVGAAGALLVAAPPALLLGAAAGVVVSEPPQAVAAKLRVARPVTAQRDGLRMGRPLEGARRDRDHCRARFVVSGNITVSGVTASTSAR